MHSKQINLSDDEKSKNKKKVAIIPKKKERNKTEGFLYKNTVYFLAWSIIIKNLHGEFKKLALAVYHILQKNLPGITETVLNTRNTRIALRNVKLLRLDASLPDVVSARMIKTYLKQD